MKIYKFVLCFSVCWEVGHKNVDVCVYSAVWIELVYMWMELNDEPFDDFFDELLLLLWVFFYIYD